MNPLASVDMEIERQREALLDLSTDNPLLDLSAGAVLRLGGPEPDGIFESLAGEGWRLPFVAADGPANRAEPHLLAELAADLLTGRLLSLAHDARTRVEEDGTNALYLAIGTLEWNPGDTPEARRAAPILLVPVALERRGAGDQFTLLRLPGDPIPNPALALRLRRDFGIVLPDPAAASAAGEARLHIETVAAAVAPRRSWGVTRGAMALGLFDLGRFAIRRDLDPDRWPEASALGRHPILCGLLRDGFASPLLSEDMITTVLEADRGQVRAVAAARTAPALVIDGPPGTGKSQTIANLIADAVSRGESVLFLARKAGGIETVADRLGGIGLGAACLNLHGHNALRPVVLEQLRRTLELGSSPSAPPERADAAASIAARLAEQAAILHHRLDPSGFTAAEVLGHLVRLASQGVPASGLPLRSPESWSPRDRAERDSALHGLLEQVRGIGLPAAHPWRDTGLDAALPAAEEAGLMTATATLRSRLRLLLEQARRLAALLEAPQPERFAGIDLLLTAATAVGEAPAVDRTAILDPVWDDRPEAVASLCAAGQRLQELRAQLAGTVSEAGWTADLGPIRDRLQRDGHSWFRRFHSEYRAAVTALRALTVSRPPGGLDQRLALLDAIEAARAAAKEIAADDEVGRAAFGSEWNGAESDWANLRATVDWVQGLAGRDLPGDGRTLLARVEDRPGLAAQATAVSTALPALLADLETLLREIRFDTNAAFGASSLAEASPEAVERRLSGFLSAPAALHSWIAYRVQADRAERLGLGAFAEALHAGRLAPDAAPDAYAQAYYAGLWDAVRTLHPGLDAFDTDTQAQLLADYAQADADAFTAARAAAAQAHLGRGTRPEAIAPSIALLDAEIGRERDHMPLPRLLRDAAPAIQALKPVLMASPANVSELLEPGGLRFDLLVVDEANQLRTAEALGAAARCRRMAIVGDPRQLPPPGRPAESLMERAHVAGLPRYALTAHYRSLHPSLIGFADRAFYGGALQVPSSPYPAGPTSGLRLVHLPQGRCDPATGVNKVEAAEIAAAVMAHARSTPDLSLGVGVLTPGQRDAVLLELERLRLAEPGTASFFSGGPSRRFIVKTADELQGDERDVMLLSLAYGRDAAGMLPPRIPGLDGPGAAARLNILTTRARRACVVLASVRAEEIDPERHGSEAASLLRDFLRFARSGEPASAPAVTAPPTMLAAQIAAALAGSGFDVAHGTGGLDVDLAVRHPSRGAQPLLGLILDDDAANDAAAIRDSELLRPKLLHERGWALHRTWSLEWLMRPDEALARILSALGDMTQQPTAAPAPDRPPAAPAAPDGSAGTARPHVEPPKLRIAATPYRQTVFEAPVQIGLDELPAGALARIVAGIVEIEGPIHGDEIVARVAGLWKMAEPPQGLDANVAHILRVAAEGGRVVAEDGFYTLPNQTLRIRNRARVTAPGLRRPEMLPPAELRAAIGAVAGALPGAGRDQLVLGTAQLLGLGTPGANLRKLLERAIEAHREQPVAPEAMRSAAS